MTIPVSDLQSVAPGAIIELFELELNVEQHGIAETYRFHAGSSLNANSEVVWNGNPYMRYPLEADGFEYTGNGQLPRPKLRVSNVLGVITGLILTLPNGIEGAQVTRIRTLARYLDDANWPSGNPYLPGGDQTAEFPREVFYIDRKSVENRDVIEFELAAAFDLAVARAPKRQCLANICSWQYRSAECGYSGTSYYDKNDTPVASAGLDQCGKRLSSCEVRFEPFTRTGSVTSGSPHLSVTQPLSAAVGTPVYGHGIPNGATVSSVSASGLIVTLSTNASANTVETRTGTVQATRSTISLANAAGIAKGMSVVGQHIPSGTTVTGIAGNIVTISQLANISPVFVDGVGGTVSNNRLIIFSPVTYTPGTTLYVKGTKSNGFGEGYHAVKSIGAEQLYPDEVGGFYPVYTYATPANTLIQMGFGGRAVSLVSTYDFYAVQNYSASSYAFRGSQIYTFRSKNSLGLPFGGFPGIGVYSS